MCLPKVLNNKKLATCIVLIFPPTKYCILGGAACTSRESNL